MIIPLPDEYSYKDIAEVKDDILHVFVPIKFEDLMYDLTYAVKDSNYCYYCSRPLSRDRSTLDHLYPRDLGGPTIPNNLCISCSNCNSNKSNMFEKEFLTYSTLSSQDKKAFYRDYGNYLHFLKKWYSPVLPPGWVTYERIGKIIMPDVPFPLTKGKTYNKVKKLYKKYGRLYRAIIVDRNNKLLDGFNTLIFSQDNSITLIPTITLENVELDY